MPSRAMLGTLMSLLLLPPTSLPAQETASAPQTAEEFEATLGYQSGAITLKGGLATLTLPSDFRFLPSEGTTRLLEQGWGNPPGSSEGTLGMLIPTAFSPLSAEGWGVVITYDEHGYVDDKGAAEIDYIKLLKEMQEATEANNEAR